MGCEYDSLGDTYDLSRQSTVVWMWLVRPCNYKQQNVNTYILRWWKKSVFHQKDKTQTVSSCFSRVFLRAINQYAEVLNKKFLDQTNFELQVRAEPVHVFFSFVKHPDSPPSHLKKDVLLVIWMPFYWGFSDAALLELLNRGAKEKENLYAVDIKMVEREHQLLCNGRQFDVQFRIF